MQPAAAQGAGEEQDQGAAGGGNEPDENTVCPSGPTTHGDDRFIHYAAHADTSIPIWESRQPSHLLRRPDDRNDTVLIGAKIIHLKERRLHADAPLTGDFVARSPAWVGPSGGPCPPSVASSSNDRGWVTGWRPASPIRGTGTCNQRGPVCGTFSRGPWAVSCLRQSPRSEGREEGTDHAAESWNDHTDALRRCARITDDGLCR